MVQTLTPELRMRLAASFTALLLAPTLVAAQAHQHTSGMKHPEDGAPKTLPVQAGQAAYAAVAEVVAILEADSTTDWTRVDLEALRQHLIDMNEVTINSAVRQTPIEGGIAIEVSGSGRTLEAIRRMVTAHAPMLDGLPGYAASAAAAPAGARLTVTAERAGDAATIARIRGLGFIGLLTAGNHHAAHHLAVARGDRSAHSH